MSGHLISLRAAGFCNSSKKGTPSHSLLFTMEGGANSIMMPANLGENRGHGLH